MNDYTFFGLKIPKVHKIPEVNVILFYILFLLTSRILQLIVNHLFKISTSLISDVSQFVLFLSIAWSVVRLNIGTFGKFIGVFISLFFGVTNFFHSGPIHSFKNTVTFCLVLILLIVYVIRRRRK